MSDHSVASFFDVGAEALEIFRDELVKDRSRIENEDEPAFDVIIDLLDRCIAETRRQAKV